MMLWLYEVNNKYISFDLLNSYLCVQLWAKIMSVFIHQSSNRRIMNCNPGTSLEKKFTHHPSISKYYEIINGKKAKQTSYLLN